LKIKILKEDATRIAKILERLQLYGNYLKSER